jgi:hypothetical protein
MNNLEYNSDSDSNYDSEYDSEYDAEEEDLYIESDNVSNTRFNIVLCELYYKLHGNNKEDKIFYYHLNICRFKQFNSRVINKLCDNYNTYYHYLANNKSYSPIRNFNTIVSRNNYIKPEIAETIVLESGHSICILKTFWLRLIQRTWKRIYKERCRIIKLRCCYASLKEREITGRWPEKCRVYPGLTCCLKLF